MTNGNGLTDFQQGVYDMLSKIKGVTPTIKEETVRQTPSIWELSDGLIVSRPVISEEQAEPIITELGSKNSSRAGSITALGNDKLRIIHDFMKSKHRL